MSKLKLSHLVARIATIPEKRRRHVVGVRSRDSWKGEYENQVNGVTYAVRQCDSPIAFRDALRQPKPNAINVLVTGLSDNDLGLDSLLRLAGSRMLTIDRWQLVKDSFHARSVDPRISHHNWIAELLIDIKPAGGFSPVAGGFLDAETVWPLMLRATIGMRADTMDLQTILNWSKNSDFVKRWRSMPEEFHTGAIEWMTTVAGPAAALILHAATRNDSPDALPIGLALDVLLNPKHRHELSLPLVRLDERFLGGQSPRIELLQRWAVASKNVVHFQLENSPTELKQALSRADAILKEIGADAMAYLSDVSPIGFNQRLSRFGTTLADQISQQAFVFSDPLRERCQAIFGHMKAQAEPLRLDRIKMAVRLLRWLGKEKQQPSNFGSFEEAADYQLAEGSFVDWARLSINVVEPSSDLSSAFEKLFNAASQIRHQQAQRFANLLSEWTGLGQSSRDLPGIENVLSQIVAPLAKRQPILLIVMDGMSTAVFRELITDIVRRDWYWLVGEQRGRLGGALATIPSVTERSRSSLLCGKLVKGAHEMESREFPKHDALLKCCKAGHPPELFHKSALAPGDESDLSGRVRMSIQDTDKQVVSVVVNAIDDHLEKSQQLETSWTRDGIKVLPLLLHEAKTAGRLVVLVSDHGHIIECNTTYVPAEGAGERWRPAEGAPGDGELLIQGSRVVNEANKVIAPWNEKIRYTRGKKNGYHGGINPQEMIFPIAVISPTDDFPAGWIEAAPDDPLWWDEQYFQPTVVEAGKRLATAPPGLLFDLYGSEPEEVPSESTKVQTHTPGEQETTPTGSAPVSQVKVAEWIESLMASSVFDSQKEMVTRGRPSDDLIRNVLAALDQQGGKLTDPALARAVAMPQMRVRGLISNMIRILNVDSYDILKYDAVSNTIELNKELLVKQFGLKT